MVCICDFKILNRWKGLFGVILFFSLFTKQTMVMGFQRESMNGRNESVKQIEKKMLVPFKSTSVRSIKMSTQLSRIGNGQSLGQVQDHLNLRPLVNYKLTISLLLLTVCILGGFLYRNNKYSREKIDTLEAEINELKTCLIFADDRQDWLIKEIHHRVKNNLQVIMSLLNTQASFLTNEEAIKAIRNSQHRLFAITLVHQKLYQTANLSSIDMVAYTHELVEYLQDEYNNESKKITFKIAMVPLMLTVETAVPFGLIINEAISNALKFAFLTRTMGQIDIALESCNQIDYSFQIADNGIGLAHDKETGSVDSFGNNLITGLARQIGGSCQIENNGGVKILLQFTKKQEPETMAV